MKTKNLILLILLLVVVATSAVFLYFNKPNTITIQDKEVTSNTKPLTVKIVYPYISGLDDFNQKVKAIIDKEFNNFKNNSLENDAAVKEIDPAAYAQFPRGYELDISYTAGEVDENIVSIVFEEYNFEGGAHGATIFIPLNYNVKTKQIINLADLFEAPSGSQPDYLKKVSDFCIADLTRQLTKSLGSLDGTWIQDGAGPKLENYSTFLISKNNIIFYFPQYQVAYGAAGNFQVVYPR